jgi:hypothetical protein
MVPDYSYFISSCTLLVFSVEKYNPSVFLCIIQKSSGSP